MPSTHQQFFISIWNPGPASLLMELIAPLFPHFLLLGLNFYFWCFSFLQGSLKKLTDNLWAVPIIVVLPPGRCFGAAVLPHCHDRTSSTNAVRLSLCICYFPLAPSEDMPSMFEKQSEWRSIVSCCPTGRPVAVYRRVEACRDFAASRPRKRLCYSRQPSSLPDIFV